MTDLTAQQQNAGANLPETIPVFPLNEVLLLPRGRLPLNIFENKYLKMVDDALANGRLIGMVQLTQSTAGAGSVAAPIHKTGCVGRISYFEETDDGRYLINLTGVCRYDIIDEMTDSTTPYRRVHADFSPYTDDLFKNGAQIDNMDGLLKTLDLYFNKMDMTCEKWHKLQNIDQEKLIATLSMVCPFSTREKQALLEASCVKTRAELLQAMMEMAIREYDTNNRH